MRALFLVVTLVVVLLLPEGVRGSIPAPPRLVVVISLDQFPYEYLTRFAPYFAKGGFLRLAGQGASFVNASYKHAVNLTGPGHAVILSGAYGDQNGIIANNWYDPTTQSTVYCVEDKSVTMTGALGKGRSPANLISATYGDQLRLHTGFQSKVISVSHKDRAAILLGVKLANGAYWLSDSLFVTSSYYMSELPSWVRAFNASGTLNSYFGREWKQHLPESAFANTDVDDAPYEDPDPGLGRIFPHPITGNDRARISPSYYSALATSPFGSECLAAFARAAVKGEHLGTRGVTDLLCVSFSSTDYVGHAFGPHSREVMEMTVAIDGVIAGFLDFLDAEIGKGNYVVALTSDHGVSPTPEYILTHVPHADAGRVPPDSIAARCEGALSTRFGAPAPGRRWIARSVDRNIHFDPITLAAAHVTVETAAQTVVPALAALRGVAAVFTRAQLQEGSSASPLLQKAVRSFHPLRSGDLFFVLKPYYFEGRGSEGTTHGEPYDYSAHVPLMLMGPGIARGVYAVEASPADLAPTLSALTGIEFPAGREGRVLHEALR
jgi:predicted AlkP superfamily pyrophosphatase or phosphodiesterase